MLSLGEAEWLEHGNSLCYFWKLYTNLKLFQNKKFLKNTPLKKKKILLSRTFSRDFDAVHLKQDTGTFSKLSKWFSWAVTFEILSYNASCPQVILWQWRQQQILYSSFLYCHSLQTGDIVSKHRSQIYERPKQCTLRPSGMAWFPDSTQTKIRWLQIFQAALHKSYVLPLNAL